MGSDASEDIGRHDNCPTLLRHDPCSATPIEGLGQVPGIGDQGLASDRLHVVNRRLRSWGPCFRAGTHRHPRRRAPGRSATRRAAPRRTVRTASRRAERPSESRSARRPTSVPRAPPVRSLSMTASSPVHPPVDAARDGNPAASARDDDLSGPRRFGDRSLLDHAQRSRRGHDTAPSAALLLHQAPAAFVPKPRGQPVRVSAGRPASKVARRPDRRDPPSTWVRIADTSTAERASRRALCSANVNK